MGSPAAPDPARDAVADVGPASDSHLDVRDVWLRRGTRPVFEGLCCAFPRGAITVIAGASGGGKTTLLRILACLLRPDRGEVWVDGKDELTGMDRAGQRAFRDHVGMLFQHGALLDSMTVYDNVALPLREHAGVSEAEIRERVEAVFASVDLADVGALLPGELSGGMVKRAGLARALIRSPDILLCDEPFSGLDPPTVRRVEALLADVNRRTGATMVVTSHHVASTLRTAAHVVMLLDRRAACGTPAELVEHPDSRVSDFFREPEALPAARASVE